MTEDELDRIGADLLDAALDYLAAGLHILALTGKKPNPRVHGEHWSWDDSFHGAPVTDAECEAIQLSFTQRGTTGIAILIPKDFCVADVDTPEAASLLQELGGDVVGGNIIALTKNGIHVWYWAPGVDRNRWLGSRTLLLKGFGGYVVAPPSLHFGENGEVDGQYQWGANPLVLDGKTYMPETLPKGARDIIAMEDQFLAAEPERDSMAVFTLVPREGVPWYLWEKVWDYNTGGLERAIETAADGNQNNVIHWAASTARDEGVPLEVAMTRLLNAAKRGNHPENRARATIRGAYKRGAR